MKVTCNKKDLLAAINAAFKAVPSKASIPIMECFKLEATDEKLEITATDGMMTIISIAEAKGEGTACLGAKLLLDAIRTLPDTDIELSTDEASCKVDYGTGMFSLPCYPTEDFPTITVDMSKAMNVAVSEKIKTGLSFTLPAVAKDPMRPALNGVFFNPTDNGFDLVATDAHGLALKTIACDRVPTEGFIIPTSAATFIRDNVSVDDTVMFCADDTKAEFWFGHIILIVTKIVGTFPKYQSIIPANNQNILTAPREDLLASIRRVATCANRASQTVKLELQTIGDTSIEAQDVGFGCAAREDMEFVSYNGESMNIGFKHELLCDLLAAMSADEVTVSFGNNRQAALITCSDETCKSLIMPVAIQ